MTHVDSDAPPADVFQALAARLGRDDRFAEPTLDDSDPRRLSTRPARGPDEAVYFVTVAPGEPVSYTFGLAAMDRWLSESIEADLMFRGDELDELLAEELADQGAVPEDLALVVKHYRDEQLRYVFESTAPAHALTLLRDDEADRADAVASGLHVCLRAYEATFRELGDMRVGD